MRAHDILTAGSWETSRRRGVVLLDFDRRSRRRIALQAEDGFDFLLDLRQPRRLRHGDGLLLESGDIVEVLAAPEPLLEIRCDGAHQLVRLAWHLGNRHVPTELRPECLRIRADHVLAEMARRLGASVLPLEAPFDPEGGAYESGGHAGHHQGRDDDDHHHGHDHHHVAARASWR